MRLVLDGGEIKSCEIEIFFFFHLSFEFFQLRTFEAVLDRRQKRLTSLLNLLCFHAQL